MEFTQREFDISIRFKENPDQALYKALLDVPTDPENIEELMAFAADQIVNNIDTNGMHRLLLDDSTHSVHIIIIAEIQSLSVLAPDKL